MLFLSHAATPPPPPPAVAVASAAGPCKGGHNKHRSVKRRRYANAVTVDWITRTLHMSKLLLLPPSVIANSTLVNKLSLGEVITANPHF